MATLYFKLGWEGETIVSVFTVSSIVEPRLALIDYNVGHKVTAKYKGTLYNACDELLMINQYEILLILIRGRRTTAEQVAIP